MLANRMIGLARASSNEDAFDTDTTAQYTQVGTGTWAISAGELVATGGANTTFIRNSTSYADVFVECDCNYAADGGLVVRFVDNNNYYLLSLRDDSGVAPSQNFRLLKRVGGTFTQLATADFAWTRGASKTIRFEVSGTSLQAFVGGVGQISVTDSGIAGPGGVGFRNDGGGGSQQSKYQAFRWGIQP